MMKHKQGIQFLRYEMIPLTQYCGRNSYKKEHIQLKIFHTQAAYLIHARANNKIRSALTKR